MKYKLLTYTIMMMMSSNYTAKRTALLDAIDKIRDCMSSDPERYQTLMTNCPWKDVVNLFDHYKDGGIDVDILCEMNELVCRIIGLGKVIDGSATSYILEELGEFIDLIRECNVVVMSEREPDMEIEWKTDGRGRKSAVTQADLKCNALICDHLEDVCAMLSQWMGNGKKYIVISEENAEMPFEERAGEDVAGAFWVDPLDGTANFIGMDADTGQFLDNDFTVNIAYCEPVKVTGDNGVERMRWEPKFGIVSLPATGEIYYGHCDLGSFKIDADGEEMPLGWTEDLLNGNDIDVTQCVGQKLFEVGGERPPIRVAVSAKHPDPKTKGILERYFGEHYRSISAGSSKKILMVVDGLPRCNCCEDADDADDANDGADIYLRPGPTMEWDIAAAHAVLKFAGGTLVEYVDGMNNFYDMPEVEYNKPSLYNTPFVSL